MGEFSKKDQQRLESAVNLEPSPIPTHCITNGEHMPKIRQTASQKKVAAKLNEIADKHAVRQGLTRREFLKTPCGYAAAFMAMNSVFGPVFAVTEEEISDPLAAMNSSANRLLKNAFILDLHTHSYESPPPGPDDTPGPHQTDQGFRAAQEMHTYAINELGPIHNFFVSSGGPANFAPGSFSRENYVKEVFIDSHTEMAMLFGVHGSEGDSSADLTSNQDARNLADAINRCAGKTRVITAATFNPRRSVDGMEPLEAFQYAIDYLRPASMKGWSVGNPLVANAQEIITAKAWALDDFALMQPFYDEMNNNPNSPKNFNIHKGAVGLNYNKLSAVNVEQQQYFQMLNAPRGEGWGFATVDDVGYAAAANPDLNFIVIHCAMAALGVSDANEAFGVDGDQWVDYLFNEHYVGANDTRSPERPRGVIDWMVGGTKLDSMGGLTREETSLVDIPEAFGVDNVYVELSTTFAHNVVADPKFTAVMLGILAEGLGPDHVLWASDSLLYGSPQWQLEAFARLRIYDLFNQVFNEDLEAILGMPESQFKTRVLGLNAVHGPMKQHIPKDAIYNKATGKHSLEACFDDSADPSFPSDFDSFDDYNSSDLYETEALHRYFENDQIAKLKTKYEGTNGQHRSNRAYGQVLKQRFEKASKERVSKIS